MTRYRLAKTPADYRKAHNYLRHKGRDAKLSFPTVMAERNGAIVGVYGTHPDKDAIVSGPLEAESVFIGIRMIAAYERFLSENGIHTYIFYIDKRNHSWRKSLERSNPLSGKISRYAEDDHFYWYMRAI